MTMCPPSSTPTVTGESCGDPSRLLVASTARWFSATNRSAASTSTSSLWCRAARRASGEEPRRQQAAQRLRPAGQDRCDQREHEDVETDEWPEAGVESGRDCERGQDQRELPP